MTRSPRSLRWLWLLCAAGALTQTGLNLLRPVTSYKLIALEAGPVTIGITTAAYAILPLLTALWLGRLSDRMSSLRLMMGLGVVLLAIGGAGLALLPSVLGIAAASAVLGLGHLAFTIAGQTSIARIASDDGLDAGFGWFTASFSVGQMLGPLLGGLIVGSQSVTGSDQGLARIELALWAGSGLALAALLPVILRSSSGAMRSASPDDDAPRASVLSVMRVPGVTPQMAASLGLLAMLDILTAFLPLVGEHAGVAPVVVGVLLAIRGGASILSRAVLPRLVRRFSRSGLLKASLLGSALALAVPPLVMEQVWLAGILLAIGGFFLGLGQPLTMSMITTAVPASWRGSALAVRLMANRLGQVGMPLIAGAVAAPLGPASAIWLSCAVLAASGVERTLRSGD